MTLRETMARDALALTKQDEFGETITYVFKDGTPERVVSAVVNRLDLEPAAPGATQVAKLMAVIAIPNNSTTGVTAHTPGDKVLVPMKLGGAAVSARITRVVSQDEGMWVFEVKA